MYVNRLSILIVGADKMSDGLYVERIEDCTSSKIEFFKLFFFSNELFVVLYFESKALDILGSNMKKIKFVDRNPCYEKIGCMNS